MSIRSATIVGVAAILVLAIAACSAGGRVGGRALYHGPGWHAYYGPSPWRSCCRPRRPIVVVPPDVIDPEAPEQLPIDPPVDGPDFGGGDFGGDFGGFGGDFGGGDFGGFDL